MEIETTALVDDFREVCDLDDLWEGETRLVDVDNIPVLLVHTDDGVITAVQARCPHQGVSLSDAELCGRVLTCPMHLWSLDVVSGRGVNPSHAELATYPTLVEDGTVHVSVVGVSPKSSKP